MLPFDDVAGVNGGAAALDDDTAALLILEPIQGGRVAHYSSP